MDSPGETRPEAEDRRREAAVDMRPAEAEGPAAQESRPGAAPGTHPEAAESSRSAAAVDMRWAVEADWPRAAAIPPEGLRRVARQVGRLADFRRLRRTRHSAHWPRRIVDKGHCSSRVTLQLRREIRGTNREHSIHGNREYLVHRNDCMDAAEATGAPI
jgi:hypothetical protein